MIEVDRQRLVLFLLVLIAVFELVVGRLGLPGWPSFLAMIFFFVEHMDVKKAPSILVGGAFGIACILLATPIIHALAPVLGADLARLSYILILVYAIVAFGETLPLLFNNYAFMYLTVTGLAVPNPNPFVWMAMAAIGGGALIAGVVGIGQVMLAMTPAGRAPVAEVERSRG